MSVQTCENMSLLLRFGSDLVSTKCKPMFAVANFHNSSSQFFQGLPGILISVSCLIVLSMCSYAFLCLKKFCRSI